MKYLKLKEITAADIENARNRNITYKDHDQLLLAATEEKQEEQYYSCTLPIGSCSRNNLTNRSQKATLDFGVNMQDLKFEMQDKKFKLYKNGRGILTYIEENTYNNSVKMIAGKNREIKLHGGSREGRNQDPRKLFNDKEVPERETELKEKKKG